MKVIKYKFLSAEINHGTEETPNIVPFFINKQLECPTQADFDVNYTIAEKEAYQGKIDVDGEFGPEPELVETTDDVLNALLGVTV